MTRITHMKFDAGVLAAYEIGSDLNVGEPFLDCTVTNYGGADIWIVPPATTPDGQQARWVGYRLGVDGTAELRLVVSLAEYRRGIADLAALIEDLSPAYSVVA